MRVPINRVLVHFSFEILKPFSKYMNKKKWILKAKWINGFEFYRSKLYLNIKWYFPGHDLGMQHKCTHIDGQYLKCLQLIWAPFDFIWKFSSNDWTWVNECVFFCKYNHCVWFIEAILIWRLGFYSWKIEWFLCKPPIEMQRRPRY